MARQVNDRLVSEARAPAMADIQRLLGGLMNELERVNASAAMQKSAAEELQKLLATAAAATSIAHIAQARQQAEGAYDRALSAVEKAQVLPAPKPGVPAPAPLPPVKKRRVVEAKALWTGEFIETADDVKVFVEKLRCALQAAVDAGERVQIK